MLAERRSGLPNFAFVALSRLMRSIEAASITIGGDLTMRRILLAMLVAAGMGLAGTSGASAVPVNGAAIGDIAADHVTQVQWGHGRWGSFGGGGHGRWGSFGGGGHGRWGSFGGGGHGRWGSFGGGGHGRWGSFGGGGHGRWGSFGR